MGFPDQQKSWLVHTSWKLSSMVPVMHVKDRKQTMKYSQGSIWYCSISKFDSGITTGMGPCQLVVNHGHFTPTHQTFPGKTATGGILHELPSLHLHGLCFVKFVWWIELTGNTLVVIRGGGVMHPCIGSALSPIFFNLSQCTSEYGDWQVFNKRIKSLNNILSYDWSV